MSLTDSKKMGVLSQVDYSSWASPMIIYIYIYIYIKKKPKEIRVCMDFSTGLNNALKSYPYSLLGLEEVFCATQRESNIFENLPK